MTIEKIILVVAIVICNETSYNCMDNRRERGRIMKDSVNKKEVNSENRFIEVVCAKCRGTLIFSDTTGGYVCDKCRHIIPDTPDLNYFTDDYESLVYPPSKTCPHCNAPLKYIPSFDRIVCDHCNAIYVINYSEQTQKHDVIYPFRLTSKKDLEHRFRQILTAEHVSKGMLNSIDAHEAKAC